MALVQKIVPSLWFDGNAKEAIDYYVSVFPNSRVTETQHYPEESLLADFQKDLTGQVLSIEYELEGQSFLAINAGPEFKFSEAISFIVNCKDQAEIDYYWEKLSAVPESEQCGWCKDKYGLSWQIVPRNINELAQGANGWAKMMGMGKIVIAEFEQ